MKIFTTALALASFAITSTQAATVVIESDSGADRETTGTWLFSTIQGNSAADFGNSQTFTVLQGNVNGGAANVSRANNGVAQTTQDQPGSTFFFNDGQQGRIQMDLGDIMTVTMINSFSWHVGSRTPQNYSVYGATAPSDSSPTFADAGFLNDVALLSLGYTKIASVLTTGGNNQVGVNITDIGDYRYILFDINTASGSGGVGTFFGEIDIFAITPVPEPSSIALIGLGGLALILRRRK